MYTTTTINSDTNESVHSSKRIYLDHKTTQTMILPTCYPDSDGGNIQPVQSTIYFTSVPLSAQSNRDTAKALDIAKTVFEHCLFDVATEAMNVEVKVREKDHVFVAVCSYGMRVLPDQSIAEQEKALWYNLKMETLKTLLKDEEVGPYLPVSDQQVEQLAEYVQVGSI